MLARRLGQSLIALSSICTALLAGCTGDAGKDEGGVGADKATAGDVQRPTQFVVLAFDGSLNNDFWEESRAFAKEANVKFTYFISGVYFIPDASKRQYIAPHGLGAGKSAIGFGGEADSIATRYGNLQKAFDEGHEIASHANGHFDGSSWTEEDWESEFEQFDKIIFQGVNTTPNLTFDATTSIGFRAPQLGHSTGLYKVLKKRNYAYDTSKTAASNHWPTQNDGVWDFPLADLRIVGSGKRTLSMDYNFYVADSGGNPNSANKEKYKQQMIDTYMQYFQSNYFGNRAPLHIGHHFSKWNGGAYWEAMQAFAKRVCGLPEVKCGTYKDLLAFVNENKSNLSAYQAGNFTKMPKPPSAEVPEPSAPFTDEEAAEVLKTRVHCDDEATE